MQPSRHQFTVQKQIVEHIPPNLVPKLARKHGVDKQSRKFTPWSHVNSMLFAQLSYALQSSVKTSIAAQMEIPTEARKKPVDD